MAAKKTSPNTKTDNLFIIGGSTLTGINAEKAFAELCEGLSFPLEIKVKNQSAYEFILPGYCRLKQSYAAENNTVVTLKNSSEMGKFISAAQSIAEIRNLKELLLIEIPEKTSVGTE